MCPKSNFSESFLTAFLREIYFLCYKPYPKFIAGFQEKVITICDTVSET